MNRGSGGVAQCDHDWEMQPTTRKRENLVREKCVLCGRTRERRERNRPAGYSRNEWAARRDR